MYVCHTCHPGVWSLLTLPSVFAPVDTMADDILQPEAEAA